MSEDTIKLSAELFSEAKEIGKARHDSNREAGVMLDVRSDHYDGYKVDAEGVAGEMAFAQLIDAPESEWDKIRHIRPTSAVKGEDFGDCDYRGYRFDVKTTPYQGGHVLVTTSKLLSTNIDGYVLMCGEEGEYRFAGCISHGRVVKGIMDGRYRMKSRDTYWVAQSDLRPLPPRDCSEDFRAWNKKQVDAYRARLK